MATKQKVEQTKYKVNILSRSKAYCNQFSRFITLNTLYMVPKCCFNKIGTRKTLTFRSLLGSLKLSSKVLQCSVRSLSILLASMAFMRYSLTSSSGFLSLDSLGSLNGLKITTVFFWVGTEKVELVLCGMSVLSAVTHNTHFLGNVSVHGMTLIRSATLIITPKQY